MKKSEFFIEFLDIWLEIVVNVENSNVFVNFQIENITINLFENIVIKSFVVFKTILTLVLSGL